MATPPERTGGHRPPRGRRVLGVITESSLPVCRVRAGGRVHPDSRTRRDEAASAESAHGPAVTDTASESSVHAGLDSPPRTRPDARITRMFRSTDGPRQFRHRRLAPWKDPYTSKSERCVTFRKVRRQFSVNKDLYNSLLRAISVHSVCRLKKYRGRAPD